MRTTWILVLTIIGLAPGCGDNLMGADELTVSPAQLALAPGDTETVTASYRFGDATTPADDVVWTSSAPGVASVTGSGASVTVTGVAGGSATITATGLGLTASINVEVSGGALVSLAITPPDPTLAPTTTLPLAATGTYSDGSTADLTASATWTTDDVAIATVDAAGLLTGVAPGVTTVSAAVGTVSASTSVTVTAATLVSLEISPTDPTVAAGLEQPFTATGVFSDTTVQDLTDQVTWTAGDAAIATFSTDPGEEGLATAVGPGTTSITATLGAIAASTSITVTPAVIASIAIEPGAATVPVGVDQTFTATATLSDGTPVDVTTQVLWASTDAAVATISNDPGSEGVASAEAPGMTTITATLDGVTGMAALTVSDAALVSLVVSPETPTVPEGVAQQFTAMGTFTDGSTADVTALVTWASTATGVATISNAPGSRGLASTNGVGTTTISASAGAVADSTTLTVTDAVLVSIAVTPANRILSVGLGQQYTAVGTFSDGSTTNLTASVTWGSSDPAVATISNAAGSRGRATTVGAGVTEISATLGGVTGTATLTASACHLVINEVQVIGANDADEFVELHNPCGFAVNATGWRLVHRDPTGTADITLATIDDSIGPGGYRLYAGLGYDDSATPDGTFGAATGVLDPLGGGLGIRAGIANTGPLMDAVGWGIATNAYVETAAAPSPPASSSIRRTPNGADTNSNAADFTVDPTPTPRTANN